MTYRHFLLFGPGTAMACFIRLFAVAGLYIALPRLLVFGPSGCMSFLSGSF